MERQLTPYFDIATTYGGTVINMSTYTDNYVNPLSMDVWNLDQNDTKGWVREKGEFMLGLCEQCIGDLGTELSPITMLVMMESIQQRIVENGKSGKATWLYIDEFHVLLNSEYSAKYLQQLWKKVRKQGGLCIGITQNVVDLLQNYTATTMLANSEFVALLKQANTDSSKMTEVIGVSDAQLRFVTNSQSGMGLLKCGNVVIPFDNQIRKDTSLYKLYNTNLHEKISEMKEKEKQKNS